MYWWRFWKVVPHIGCGPSNAMTCWQALVLPWQSALGRGSSKNLFAQTNFRVTSGTWIISCINDEMNHTRCVQKWRDKLHPRSLWSQGKWYLQHIMFDHGCKNWTLGDWTRWLWKEAFAVASRLITASYTKRWDVGHAPYAWIERCLSITHQDIIAHETKQH